MKGLATVAKSTKRGRTPLYYSPSKDSVYSRPGEGRKYLTDLLKPHTSKEVRETVKYFMSL